jgi:hypothetical protein
VHVRVGAEALEPERAEGKAAYQRLGLAIGAGSPVGSSEPGADDRTAVAPAELGEQRDADRPVVAIDDGQLERLAGGAAGRQRRQPRPGLVDPPIRAPREEAGDLGIAGECEQRRCVVRARKPQRQRWAADQQPAGGGRPGARCR